MSRFSGMMMAIVVALGGCAALMHSATGGRRVGVTNALSVPICEINVVYDGKTERASLRDQPGAMTEMQQTLGPGMQAYAVLPDFDTAKVPTFDLAVHACTSAEGHLTSDAVLTTVAGLKSSDIERYRSQPIAIH